MVLDRAGGKAHLFHPVHLTDFYLSEYEFRVSSGDELWPNNMSKGPFNREYWVKRFRDRIMSLAQRGKPFPVQTVAAILATVDDISVEEALHFIGAASVDENGISTSSQLSTKATREYAIREDVDPTEFRGRQRALLCAFKEHGSASIHKITALVEGKLKTESDLGRVVTYFVNKLAREGILEITA